MVSLLSREGEVEIAKRIEEGIRDTNRLEQKERPDKRGAEGPEHHRRRTIQSREGPREEHQGHYQRLPEDKVQ